MPDPRHLGSDALAAGALSFSRSVVSIVEAGGATRRTRSTSAHLRGEDMHCVQLSSLSSSYLAETVISAMSVWQALVGWGCFAVLSAGKGSVPGGRQAGRMPRGLEGTSLAAVCPGLSSAHHQQ